MRPGSGQGVAAAASGKPRHIEIQRSFYTPLVVVFVVVFLISNINATKGVEIGPFVLDGAFFLLRAHENTHATQSMFPRGNCPLHCAVYGRATRVMREPELRFLFCPAASA